MTDTSTPTINHLGLLEAVCAAKYPRQALPSIASNRGLRLDQVLAVLEQYGWPDMDRVRAGARQLLREHNDGTGPSPVSPVPAPAAPAAPAPAAPAPAAPSPASMPPRPRPAPPAPPTPRREPSGPYIAALPASKLFADPSYQRDLDTRRVAKMVESYDPALVGILEVSDRGDGRYAILDGQHRWAVSREHAFADDAHDAEVLPDPHLACQVHTGLDVTEEAVLYHRLNTTRKQLTGWDRWVARRRAGDQVVLDIEAAVQRCGYTIGTATAPGILRGTKSCEVVVEAGGIARLEVVLGVVRGAYGDDQTGLDGSIVQGIAHVVGAYDRAELDLARLVDALAGIVPRQLAARASAVREIHRGTIDRLVAHVIVERYNTLPGRKLEPFFIRVPPASKARDAAIERNRAIRAWAAAEGIEVPPKQIPQKVREAYDAAHAGGDQ